MRVDGDRTKNRNGMTILFGVLFPEEIGDDAPGPVEAYNAKYSDQARKANLTIVTTGQRLADLVEPEPERQTPWRSEEMSHEPGR